MINLILVFSFIKKNIHNHTYTYLFMLPDPLPRNYEIKSIDIGVIFTAIINWKSSI